MNIPNIPFFSHFPTTSLWDELGWVWVIGPTPPGHLFILLFVLILFLYHFEFVNGLVPGPASKLAAIFILLIPAILDRDFQLASGLNTGFGSISNLIHLRQRSNWFKLIFRLRMWKSEPPILFIWLLYTLLWTAHTIKMKTVTTKQLKWEPFGKPMQTV